MFRRSKIKITPKIPQAKANVDRSGGDSTSTPQQTQPQPTTLSSDSSTSRLPQSQALPNQKQINQPNSSPSATNSEVQSSVITSDTATLLRNVSNQLTGDSIVQVTSPISNSDSRGNLSNTVENVNLSTRDIPQDQITPNPEGSCSLSLSSLPTTEASTISVNQIQGNQETPIRRNSAQGSTSLITARPSQPPPATPSNPPPSISSSGDTSIVNPATPTRLRSQSISKESLPPPPPPPPLSALSSVPNVSRGDSVESDQQLTTTIVREDSHSEPKRPRKRIKLTPEDLLDRNSITLYHLIHASITRTKKSDKKKPKEKKPDEGMADENLEETNSESGSKGLVNPSEALRVENDDTMDSIMTTASSASTIIASEPGADEEPREKETIGPRVKVGPDGQLIIDEESLVIRKPKPVETVAIEEAVSGKTTYASFRKRPPTARWTKAETIEFYTALNLIGPDFSLMSNLFFNGKRTRTDLKNKFRRENKLNKPVIEKALYEADVDYCLARDAVV